MRGHFGYSQGLTGSRLALMLLLGLPACAAEAPTTPTRLPAELAAASGNPVVTSTVPSSSARNVTIDVHVLGSGFDRTAQIAFLLNGVPDARVRTNATKFLKSSELVASVTIAADATPELYDVQVTLSSGRKGIGTELFTVLTIVNLGSLDGGATQASAVNANGMVAGSSVLTKVKCGAGLNAQHPYVWTPSTGMVDIGVPGGFCTGQVAAINGSGMVVGEVKGQPARWLPNGAGWTGELLPYLGSSGSASDVNDNGTIAGQVHVNPGLSAAVWSSSGALSVLPNLPGVGSCAAMGINNLGVIAGRCAETDTNGVLVFTHAVVWTSSTQVPGELEGLAGADRNFAVRINDQGVAVGYNSFPDGTMHAVRWVPNGTTWTVEDLGTLGGSSSRAIDINEAGQIVGWSNTASQTSHAFLWEPGKGMRDLGVWHKGEDASAAGINDPAVGVPLEVVGRSGSNPIIWRP